MDMPPIEKLFFFIGRMLFPRQQDWEQTRSAKMLVLVLGFSLIVALGVAKFIKVMYYHSK